MTCIYSLNKTGLKDQEVHLVLGLPLISSEAFSLCPQGLQTLYMSMYVSAEPPAHQQVFVHAHLYKKTISK